MKNALWMVVAGGLALSAGCRSDSSATTPARTQYQYGGSALGSSPSIVVVPIASRLVDLPKPDVGVKNDAVTMAGMVRLRSGKYNPDAVLRISIIDRHGVESDTIRAVLKETDTPNLLSYKAMFAPVPPKGSSIAISYEDWHPMDNYSGSYIGSGGGGGKGSGPAVSTGQGTKNTRSSGSSKNGGNLGGLSGPKFGK